MSKKVIIVTDGDKIAKGAVETAATNIGGRCISLSWGNPTNLSGREIIDLINVAKYDPVIVMVDDRGNTGMGSGEQAMFQMIKSKEIEVIGIVAVASNTSKAKGVKIDCSVDKDCHIIDKAVDKYGNSKEDKILKGDTVNSLSFIDVPFIVGVGDPGKMDGYDCAEIGAPVITTALKKVIENYIDHNKKDCQ